MSARRFVYSLDENIDYYSKLSGSVEIEESISAKESFSELGNTELLFKYLKYLTTIDSTFLMLSYMYKMPQVAVCNIFSHVQKSRGHKLNISQVGVSVRLKRALEKIKFLLDSPNFDFIKVREDFRILFPKPIFNIAYFFFWNHTQSRTRYFLDITQCGSAFKLKLVLKYLKDTVDNKDTPENIAFLADVYLDFFTKLHNKSNTFNLFFRNEHGLNLRLQGPFPPLFAKR